MSSETAPLPSREMLNQVFETLRRDPGFPRLLTRTVNTLIPAGQPRIDLTTMTPQQREEMYQQMDKARAHRKK
jgi:hypothetical protein